MNPKADDSILVFGADVLLVQLNAIQKEIDGVRQAQDMECVHRMRISSRRLRNALGLFGADLSSKSHENWQKSIRQITKDLGAVRDLDVQIGLVEKIFQSLPVISYKPGIRRLLLRQNQKRSKLQTRVLSSLDAFQTRGTLRSMRKNLNSILENQEAIPSYSPAIYNLGFKSILFRLDAFLAYEPFIEKPECIQELHAMRIAAKHLRYTLEVFTPLYGEEIKNLLPTMRKVQDELGEIHDSDVWINAIPLFIEKERQRTLKFYGDSRLLNLLLPGLNYFLENRHEYRDFHYQEFVALWQSLKVAGTWGKLRGVISNPNTFLLKSPASLIQSQ